MERNGILTGQILLDGFPIAYQATRLDVGTHVLLTGGQSRHVGAVSVAQPGGTTQTILLPHHQEHHISDPWAEAIARRTGAPATVCCGIHYENATKEQIRRIVHAAQGLLETLLAQLPEA